MRMGVSYHFTLDVTLPYSATSPTTRPRVFTYMNTYEVRICAQACTHPAKYHPPRYLLRRTCRAAYSVTLYDPIEDKPSPPRASNTIPLFTEVTLLFRDEPSFPFQQRHRLMRLRCDKPSRVPSCVHCRPIYPACNQPADGMHHLFTSC